MTPCPLGLAGQCYCANRVNSFAAAPAKTAVLLLAHGSPETPDQTPEFLRYVTGGRHSTASSRRNPPPLLANRFLATSLLDSLQADHSRKN